MFIITHLRKNKLHLVQKVVVSYYIRQIYFHKTSPPIATNCRCNYGRCPHSTFDCRLSANNSRRDQLSNFGKVGKSKKVGYADP